MPNAPRILGAAGLPSFGAAGAPEGAAQLVRLPFSFAIAMKETPTFPDPDESVALWHQFFARDLMQPICVYF
jgi:hypothetical protein